MSLRDRVRRIGQKGRINQFLNDLEEGKYDPNYSEPEAEPTSPISPSKENKEDATAEENGVNNTEAVKSDEKKEDEEFGMDADEEAADNDTNKPDANGKGLYDGKRVPRSDEVAVYPDGNQVMIRTIPPDIGRVKLESVSPCSAFLVVHPNSSFWFVDVGH